MKIWSRGKVGFLSSTSSNLRVQYDFITFIIIMDKRIYWKKKLYEIPSCRRSLIISKFDILLWMTRYCSWGSCIVVHHQNILTLVLVSVLELLRTWSKKYTKTWTQLICCPCWLFLYMIFLSSMSVESLMNILS